MKRFKFFAMATLALGIAAPATLSAQDWRDVRHDDARVDNMRDDMARDQARLNEDLRCGRYEAAARDRRDLARDRAALTAQERDIRHDRYEGRYSSYRRDWR
jgi:hypothetical protein